MLVCSVVLLCRLSVTWQLMQVNHIAPRPLILMGDMWKGLIDWLEAGPLAQKLMDQKDFDRLIFAKSIDEVMQHLEPHIELFYKEHPESWQRINGQVNEVDQKK